MADLLEPQARLNHSSAVKSPKGGHTEHVTIFSQGHLQDYVDCPRRFELRYVLTQPWPGLIVADPAQAELYLRRGTDLHLLAQQHTLGLDPELLASTIHDPVVAQWWQTYLEHPPPDLPTALRKPEVMVGAPLAGCRLIAKYDLLAADPGARLAVVDWKTTPQPAQRALLAQRLQTRVYRFLAVEAGTSLLGGKPARPEQVEMIYWFASSGATVHLRYDAAQYDADRQYLVSLIDEILARQRDSFLYQDGQAPIWPLTNDEHQCRRCNYRSLCERNVQAAFLNEIEDDLERPEVEFDLEQIAEIEF